jgi:predicted amidohydrolase YtcJ
MTKNEELIIVNGAVLTMDERRPDATALRIRGGLITQVGSDEEIRAETSQGASVIDAGGSTVMPGIIDAHSHVRLGGNPEAVSLFGCTSLEEIRLAISEHLRAHPDVEWIEAEGWNYAAVPGGRPTAALIDDVCGGKPAWIFSYDAHTVWLNSEAIRRWDVRADNTELPFGRAEIGDDGQPTGWVHDFAVMGIHPQGQRALETVLPGYGIEAQYRCLVTNLRDAARFGITTIVEPQNGIGDVALFERAFSEGELKSRLIAAMIYTPESVAGSLDEIDVFIKDYRHDRISVGPIKLYIDDVIEPHTAAMLAPYANFPGVGSTFWPAEVFADVIVDLEQRGLQAFVHGTGDRGIRTALDGFAAGRAANGKRDTRHQIVHVECLHADDVPRFSALGVVACMQPRHCAPDIVHEWRENVGVERERYAWAMRSLIDSGAPVAFSSDWNVAEMDPLVGLYSAVTRADLEGQDAWNTDETISLAQALRGYTRGSAWANFLDDEVGVLEPGKRADIVIFDEDLTALAESSALLEAAVTHTIADGQIVYELEG